jgi:hypothetical protein
MHCTLWKPFCVLQAGLEPATISFGMRDSYPSELLEHGLWNLAESNHVPRIFSPVHTPRLPKFQEQKQQDSNL